ncbi:MAG: hypothetical protein GZ091_03665 [Paludibacter sp.]|nr:hypothetical protein [Paludibacter sp.]
MKFSYKTLIISIIAFLVLSCSSGNKAYKRGDYFNACMEAIERLRSSPGNEKSQYVLLNSYPLAQKDAQREITNAKLANGTDQYDVLVYQYERMNQLANAIYHCPKANQLIPQPTEYIAELSSAKQMAADQAYEMGIKAVEANTIDQARMGFQYFIKSNEYVPGYKDVLNKIEQARYYATIRVVVQPPYTSNKYQYTADFFYNNLLAEMVRTAKNRFVRFYSPEEASKENMRDPHQFIILNFEDFSVGNIRETNNTIELSRDSVIVGTVEVQGKKYNTYNTVKAKLTTMRQEISSGGVLSLRIVEAQNSRELQLRNFSGKYVWATEWSTFQGDDRALTMEQKKKCDQKQPQIPPSQQDLFVEFTKPIYDQSIPFLRNFYSKY